MPTSLPENACRYCKNLDTESNYLFVVNDMPLTVLMFSLYADARCTDVHIGRSVVINHICFVRFLDRSKASSRPNT